MVLRRLNIFVISLDLNLLHKRLRQEAISDKVENTQNTKTCDISCMNDIKMRMQRLEESVESKFTIMNIEFRHKP
jgi:hypothetical protein